MFFFNVDKTMLIVSLKLPCRRHIIDCADKQITSFKSLQVTVSINSLDLIAAIEFCATSLQHILFDKIIVIMARIQSIDSSKALPDNRPPKLKSCLPN